MQAQAWGQTGAEMLAAGRMGKIGQSEHPRLASGRPGHSQSYAYQSQRRAKKMRRMEAESAPPVVLALIVAVVAAKRFPGKQQVQLWLRSRQTRFQALAALAKRME